MYKDIILKLANEKSNPCVSIALNTHRTHPANNHDKILLKNLCKEAEERLIKEFGKKAAYPLLEKIVQVQEETDINYNLDSLHIFISDATKEVVKLPLPSPQDYVHISNSFTIRPIIKAFNRSETFLIMLLSQNGVNLYEALNNSIVSEVINDDFPFSANPYIVTNDRRKSDPKHVDNKVRVFLNEVDNALEKIYNVCGLQCAVICTEDNYTRLLQVANKPQIYLGFANINYNNTTLNFIATQAWEIVSLLQIKERADSIVEMKESAANNRVLTDIQEIYQAAIDGRGDLLIVKQSFSQPVIFNSDRTFELTDDFLKPGAVDDITNDIAWEIIIKGGRVVFTESEAMDEIGQIALKTRF